jgi:hypothetical protein
MGFDGELHMPKGAMLTIGLLSMMLAAGVPVIVKLRGNTDSTPGATPKLHCKVAPVATWMPIAYPLTIFSSRCIRLSGAASPACFAPLLL